MHFDLEMEAANQGKVFPDLKWGPMEYTGVVAEGLERFKAKNPQVPLQGLISNQILATRPTKLADGSLAVRLLDDCTEPSTQALVRAPQFKRYPPSRGVALEWALRRDAKVRAWPHGVCPAPDWETLHNSQPAVQDDMPAAPGADMGS